MHNLHLVVTSAETAEDACGMVEDYIENFGNENNWRTIRGCISDKNVIYDKEGIAGWATKGDFDTIENINKTITEMVNEKTNDEIMELMKKHINGERLTSHECYRLMNHFNSSFQNASWKEYKGKERDTFDVLNDSYYSYHYDEFGVTQMENQDDGDTLYVVFVDMHS